MKIEIDDALVEKARQDLRLHGHMFVSDEELANFFTYNSEVVCRKGIVPFFERWLSILEKAIRGRPS